MPEPWSLDDLEDYAAVHDDPFAGRVRAGARPAVVLQIEATAEPPVWTALRPAELDTWASVVSRLWQRFGLAHDDTIAFFDYGSNPCVLLSSSIYVPHLRRGAATRLGANTICNDGVASMTGRMLVILETVRPAALVVRRDLIAPLVDALGTQGSPGAKALRWVAVSEVDGAPAAKDCAQCQLFHVDRSYRIETSAPGEIVLSAPFAAECPAIRYRLGSGEVVRAGCAAEPNARRIAWG